jgi:hypothetical protein
MDDSGFTDEEAMLSQSIMQFWGNFAWGEQPADHWTPFTATNQNAFVLSLDSDQNMINFVNPICKNWKAIFA